MSAAWLGLTPLLPLLLAIFATRRDAAWTLYLAPLPAIAVALLVAPGTTLALDWLLLGVQLQLDAHGGLFLLFGALVWLAAAAYAARSAEAETASSRFRVLYLIAMSGHFLLLLAADMVAFYVGFAMMGLAAYGLLLRRSQYARRGAAVYLAFTLVGELALFAGILHLFASTGSLLFAELGGRPLPDTAVLLLLIGFGIKVALPGLHPWLPLAYTAGPITAVAVLSGPMMKAGLVGWLRFLPPGDASLEGWGVLLVWLGTAGLLTGVLIGLAQRSARAVLAYSSIAKMGTISALFGVALANPVLAPALIVALVLFAVHHMLIKPALFLAVGEWGRQGSQPWLLAAIALLVASLVGLPWTGGAGAKQALEGALQGHAGWILILSSIGTALLMARLFTLLPMGRTKPAGADLPWPLWPVLVPVAVWAPFLPWAAEWKLAAIAMPLIGLGLYLVGRAFLRSRPELTLQVPPGDVVRLLARLRISLPSVQRRPGGGGWRLPAMDPDADRQPRAPMSLTLPGVAWLTILLLLLAALLASP